MQQYSQIPQTRFYPLQVRFSHYAALLSTLTAEP